MSAGDMSVGGMNNFNHFNAGSGITPMNNINGMPPMQLSLE